jgi:hypothetical protein
MDLGERKSPSSDSDLRESHWYVESLSDVRTPQGKRRVSARLGWAGEKSDFFSILLERRGRGAMRRGSGGPAGTHSPLFESQDGLEREADERVGKEAE